MTDNPNPNDAKLEAERRKAQQDAQKAADEATERAKSATGKAKEAAQAEAQHLTEKARAMAEEQVEGIKNQATSRIDETADHIRNAGHEFGDDSYQAQAADYLASNLSQAADFIREQDLGTLSDDVSEFARRNPALFLGGAALAGFALARMIKATDRDGQYRYDYDNIPARRAPVPAPRHEAPYEPRPAPTTGATGTAPRPTGAAGSTGGVGSAGTVGTPAKPGGTTR
ncbi:hypothetical protein JSE7799_01672 [Jannaschia seosinensis]|uniref:Late embryogenesis abundant protein n=1 Tax=Jannaschia seosinensis TaxID=313367 RepID=A0A0M7BAJ8_9RHOB|nr:hypothetical protein [Jannaschia seosinensis]CUH38953.1 hypothetical protein JSE7799_01672 [Jannaschia seosinensis]